MGDEEELWAQCAEALRATDLEERIRAESGRERLLRIVVAWLVGWATTPWGDLLGMRWAFVTLLAAVDAGAPAGSLEPVACELAREAWRRNDSEAEFLFGRSGELMVAAAVNNEAQAVLYGVGRAAGALSQSGKSGGQLWPLAAVEVWAVVKQSVVATAWALVGRGLSLDGAARASAVLHVAVGRLALESRTSSRPSGSAARLDVDDATLRADVVASIGEWVEALRANSGIDVDPLEALGAAPPKGRRP